MRDILKRRGIIGPEYDKRSQELSGMLEEAITDMYLAELDEARKLAAEKATEIRNEIFQWNHRLNGPMSNSCEQIADDAKLEFLTSRIVVSDKDELVWSDYDAFLNGTDQILQTRAKFEVMLYLQGLDSDFLETVPEAVVLKEISDKKDILLAKEKEEDELVDVLEPSVEPASEPAAEASDGVLGKEEDLNIDKKTDEKSEEAIKGSVVEDGINKNSRSTSTIKKENKKGQVSKTKK